MKKFLCASMALCLLAGCNKDVDTPNVANTVADNVTITQAAANPKKFLFDATKAQTAGNADWILDFDNSGGIKRFPTPAASGITASTSETYWNGANSAWGVALVKLGHQVEQLPPGTAITFGNTSNPQDLSNYNVYVIVEPNIRYTSSEKTAILNFVNSGGGLFMIADHTRSDRNNDGIDSPSIFNDLFATNSRGADPFGFRYDLVTFSQTTSNRLSGTTNPILNGSAGSVSSMKYSAGASMSITKSTVARGLIWKTNTTQNASNVMALSATYGSGRIVALGDSSPADDGTGNPNDNLFFGWTELTGHSRFHINASLWLAKL